VDLFAVQDGGPTAPWTVIQGSQGVYVFSLTGQAGAVAVACTSGAIPLVLLEYGSPASLASFVMPPSVTYVPVSGSLEGVVRGDTVDLAVGSAAAAVSQAEWTADATPGSNDLLAVRNPAGSEPQVVVLRGVQVPVDGGDLGQVDFAQAQAMIGGHTLSSSGPLPVGDSIFLGESFQTDNGLLQMDPATSASMPIAFVPPPVLMPDDRHGFTLADESDTDTRQTTFYANVPQDVTLALPPAVATPVVTQQLSSAYQTYQVQATMDPPYYTRFTVDFNDVSRHASLQWSVVLDASYASDTVTFPDLTGLPGWKAIYGMEPADQVDVNAQANGQTFATPLPPEGGLAYVAYLVSVPVTGASRGPRESGR
jgi:hypothetical protein